MSAKAYYPLFADLTGRYCLVVGGGAVAQRKVATLLKFAAQVTVISPAATRWLVTQAQQGRIRLIRRRFRPADLRGAWLVYAATDDERINELVHREATRARVFTNVVDQPHLCSFIAPSILKRGDLVIAVSTGGASPTVAKRLRRELGKTLGAEYAQMLRLLKSLRVAAKRKLPSYSDRKRYFDRLVGGRVFALVRAGDMKAARRNALKMLEQSSAHNGT